MTDDTGMGQSPTLSLPACVLTALLCLNQSPARASEIRAVTLAPWALFDLETGQTLDAEPDNRAGTDLMWGCGPQEIETLRALSGVAWTLAPDADFAADRQTVRNAPYKTPLHPSSNYPDIFRLPASLTKSQTGRVYFLRTAEGNFAKLRIVGFDPQRKEPAVCRALRIQYQLLP